MEMRFYLGMASLPTYADQVPNKAHPNSERPSLVPKASRKGNAPVANGGQASRTNERPQSGFEIDVKPAIEVLRDSGCDRAGFGRRFIRRRFAQCSSLASTPVGVAKDPGIAIGGLDGDIGFVKGANLGGSGLRVPGALRLVLPRRFARLDRRTGGGNSNMRGNLSHPSVSRAAAKRCASALQAQWPPGRISARTLCAAVPAAP